MLLTLFAGFACNRPTHAATDLPLPHETLHAEGDDRPESAAAVFAGGCFWCTEAVFEQLDGISAVVSGYAGGKPETATYQAVSAGRTDHAEVIQITYDPSRISYGQLLRVFFAVAHDPTQKDRQGPDVGRQYRSAIFYAREKEKRVAASYIDQLNEAGVFDKPIATTLEPLEQFHAAEAYHQDFVQNNPSQGYVVVNALPKVEKTVKHFPELVKPDAAAKP
jgi:peptide-methionine (S)-S-oxide reductase